MSKVYLKVPTLDEMHYRKEWMMDPKTMDYNAGYDIDLSGYNKETGTITRTDEEMETWYNNWINKEPDKYYAYIYVNGIDEPIGEVFYYPNDNIHSMGILIKGEYRGKGYSLDALLELEKIAFEKNNINELSDMIPLSRTGAIKTFEKAGFIQTDKERKEFIFGKEETSRQLLITKEMYDLFITENIDKDPYIIDITDDKIINLTGESASGKSTFSEKYIYDDNYIVIDTDIVFDDKPSDNKESVELRKVFKDVTKSCLINDFDYFYKTTLDYFKDTDKTLVIDTAQYRNIKDCTILKGKLIVMRTCINNCFKRSISRFIDRHPGATEEEIEAHKQRKIGMFSWYKMINKFIVNVDTFVKNKEKHLKKIRSELTNKDFSLFTNNCLGGFIYHDLGLQFLSPTINLRIKPKEFISFASDLKYYLNQELIEVESDNTFPVGVLKGDKNHKDVTIYFDHYSNFEKAKEKWDERKKKVNYDNVYIMMEFYDGIHNEELIKLFEKVPYKNKMILTHKDHNEEYTTCIHQFDDDLDMNEIGGKIFRYNELTGKRYYEEFDYIKFLNKR